MSSSTISVGLVGFGTAGRFFHAPVIQAVPGLRLAAVVQRTGDSARTICPSATLVRSVDDLLALDEVRLVVIATPNLSHATLATRCLEAGRHVVVGSALVVPYEGGIDTGRNTLRRVLREHICPPLPGPARGSEPSTPNPYQQEPNALAEGRHMFVVFNCSGCHGYGVTFTGTESQLRDLISKGGHLLSMPAWQGTLNEDQIDALAAYVTNPVAYPAGESLFGQHCSSCHGDRVPASPDINTARKIIRGGEFEAVHQAIAGLERCRLGCPGGCRRGDHEQQHRNKAVESKDHAHLTGQGWYPHCR